MTARASATMAPSPRPGKMNTLLAWPISCHRPGVLHGRERRARGDHRPPVGPGDDIGRVRLRDRGRVRERQHDGPLAGRQARDHGPDDRLAEGARDPGGTHEDGRPPVDDASDSFQSASGGAGRATAKSRLVCVEVRASRRGPGRGCPRARRASRIAASLEPVRAHRRTAADGRYRCRRRPRRR